MRVVVAMSGGVDSSAVAGLLKEQGHEVIGLAMKTHSSTAKANRACCTPDDMRDARQVADILDIPFYVLNYEDVFKEQIIKPFAEAYLAGRTPNPCVDCNDKVKFRPLLERAELLGADKLATGHYAQVREDNGIFSLHRGDDSRKDQTYFLYRLSQAQLSKLWFPIGNMVKSEVREHVRRLGLPLADKHESQEICFVGKEGYAATVEKIAGRVGRAGNIIRVDGTILGEHRGIHHFTLGQRKGLGIAAPRPLYVIDIKPETGEVVVGESQELLCDSIDVNRLIWLGEVPADGTVVEVQQRYRGVPQEAVIYHQRDGIKLEFSEPQQSGAPGQAAVLYSGDRVVGGGVILPRAFHPALPLVGVS